MLGQEKLKRLAEVALSHSRSEQLEVLFRERDLTLTRFTGAFRVGAFRANHAIQESSFESNLTFRVRVVLGKRTGVAESNDITTEGIRRAVEIARVLAQAQPEHPLTPPLPTPQPISPVGVFATSTANFTPEAQGRVVASICRQAASQKFFAAGAFRTEVEERYIANSLGVAAYHAVTRAVLQVVMMNDQGTASGYSSAACVDVDTLDGDAVARAALDKALCSQNPIALAPGEYTVLLEADAVANIARHLARYTFNGLAVQEGRSYVGGKEGQLAFHPTVTLYDDGNSPETFALPFDDEGVPRQRVTLVERGVVRDVVHDSFTALQAQRASTGHALPLPNTIGPLPRHLFIAPGSAGMDDLLRAVTRGILVSRFWHTRVIHPLKVMVTGLTHDGTFLIEHGKVTLPVKNLRFTASYIDALRNVRLVGSETKLVVEADAQMSMCVPAMVVEGFRFTGIT